MYALSKSVTRSSRINANRSHLTQAFLVVAAVATVPRWLTVLLLYYFFTLKKVIMLCDETVWNLLYNVAPGYF